MYYASAFLLFCIVCTVLAFRRHPIWGVYFYLATTYVFPPGRWWGYIFGDLRWALLSAAVAMLAIVFHRGKLKPKPVWLANGPVALLAMYAAWIWVQTLWALDQSEHVRISIEFVKCMLALWFIYRAIDSKERVRDFMLAHLLGCALLGIYAYTTGRQAGRLDGVGGPGIDDANTLGMYLVTAAVVGVGLVLTQTGWRRWVALAAMALCVEGFVLANSRGAFGGLVAGGLMLAFCVAKRYRRVFWAFAVVGVIGLASLVDQVFIERMFTVTDVASDSEEADASARSRVAIAEAQLRMFSEHPMGIGWRGTAVLSPSYMDRRWLTLAEDGNPQRSSHNTFMTALTEGGLPGGLIYLCLLLWVAVAAFRLRRLRGPQHDPELVTMGAALYGAIIVVLVAGLGTDYLAREVQFWLYAALVSVFRLAEAPAQAGPTDDRAAALRHAPA
jgi:O-antigen ligase